MKLKTIGFGLHSTAAALILMTGQSALADIIVPGAYNDHIPLGTAFNSISSEFLNFQPVMGEMYEGDDTDSALTYQKNLSFRQTSSLLNGSASVGAHFHVVRVDAGAQLALDSASDAFSSSWVLSVTNIPNSQLIRGIDNVSEPSLSPSGQAMVDLNLSNSDLIKYAGDRYIDRISYRAHLLVTMKAEYLSTTDKTEIEGYLNVNFLQGTVGVEGELSSLTSEQKQSVKITVRAHQFGGDPSGLLSILPNNIVSCSLDNYEPCFALFTRAIDYGKGAGEFEGIGFSDQIVTYEDANISSYGTTAYADGGTDIEQLEAEAYNEQLNTALIIPLEDAYIAELEAQTRAQSLLNNYLGYLNHTQRLALKDIASAATNNAYALAELVDYCSNNYYGDDCATYIADNCPVEGTGRSCTQEYSTAFFNLEIKDPLTASLEKYSRLVNPATTTELVDEIIGSTTSSTIINYFTQDTPSYTASTGSIQSDTGVAITVSEGAITTEFIVESNIALPFTYLDNIGSGPIVTQGTYEVSSYQIVEEPGEEFSGWVVHQSNSVPFTAPNPANVGGKYYYRYKINNVANLIVSFAQLFVPGANMRIFKEPVLEIAMTTGLNAAGAPLYWSAENVDIAKDINNNDIGWCPGGGGVSRSVNDHCRTYGRLYTWDEANKACEAFNQQNEARTGLLWRLPNQDDWDLLVNRVEVESGGPGTGGSGLKSTKFVGTSSSLDIINFRALPGGYINDGWSTSSARHDNLNKQGVWWSSEASSNSAYRKYMDRNRNDVHNISRNKDKLYSVRCVGASNW